MNAAVDGIRIGKKFLAVSEKAKARIARANAASGQEWERLARVLIPVRTGRSRNSIDGFAQSDGAYLIRFAPLSRILEGGRKAGVSKKGHAYPSMRAFAHVTPAGKIVKPKHRRRVQAAVRAAIKEAMGGNAG